MALPFSESVSRNGFVFVSGQIYLKNGILIDAPIEEQTHQVMKNIQDVLAKDGLTCDDIVKTTIYTTDISLYSQINDVYAGYFSSEYPARELIGVKELPLGARLEISVIASKK